MNMFTFYYLPGDIMFRTAVLSAHSAEYATIATGGVNVVMTLVSAFHMDRAGRRTLMLLGVGGLLIFSAILALSLILIKVSKYITRNSFMLL